jgi:NAD(P)-dependent dehydrogenase (short-subunit alcohol dehydrogenase family)
MMGHQKEKRLMPSKQPVAIVTAASQGLGAACAKELAARGYRLVLQSSSGKAAGVAKRLGGIALKGSVSDPKHIKEVVTAAMDKYGRIDTVLNNTGHIAGGGVPSQGPGYNPKTKGRLLELSDQDWSHGLDMIILNVVRMSRLVTPIMRKQGGGAILNMSSFAGKEPSPAYPLGACLRMALAGFAKLYADRYARDNIRMNNILPGFIENWPMAPSLRQQVPMARPGTLAEVAKTAAFLLSSDAGYITGQNVLVDGGLNRGA